MWLTKWASTHTSSHKLTNVLTRASFTLSLSSDGCLEEEIVTETPIHTYTLVLMYPRTAHTHTHYTHSPHPLTSHIATSRCNECGKSTLLAHPHQCLTLSRATVQYCAASAIMTLFILPLTFYLLVKFPKVVPQNAYSTQYRINCQRPRH